MCLGNEVSALQIVNLTRALRWGESDVKSFKSKAQCIVDFYAKVLRTSHNSSLQGYLAHEKLHPPTVGP